MKFRAYHNIPKGVTPLRPQQITLPATRTKPVPFFIFSELHRMTGYYLIVGIAIMAHGYIQRLPYWTKQIEKGLQEKEAFDWWMKYSNAPDSDVLRHYSQF